ncbi:MAG: hypothetical protein KDB80_14475 [Planctomycetes bacterium]|nr:hypothetical protein [Planctomycetota bacterium]
MIALLAGIVTGLALVPIVRDARGNTRTSLALGAVAIAIVVAIASSLASADSTVPSDRPIELESTDTDFTTSRTCRACHPAEYASWHASFHRTMTQHATPDTIIPDVGREEFDYHGRRFAIESSHSGLRVSVDDRTWPVVQTTGSHHFQVFWHACGNRRKLSLFPFCYEIASATWMPIDTVFIMPPDTQQTFGTGRWNRNCIMCHATGGQPRLDVFDTRVGELGIACEACHGPAEAHVAANRDPLHRYAHRDPETHDSTIANPATMSPERSAQTCGQCHSVSAIRSRDVAEWQETGSRFRPGDDLDETHAIVTAASNDPDVVELVRSHPGFLASKFWPDGMIRIAGREYNGLIRSPCYDHGDSERRMTCLSCHEMHPPSDESRSLHDWRVDQLAEPESNAACTQCHEEFADRDSVVAHTHHAADSSGSLCLNCHMSHSTYGLLKAVRSHEISSPSVQTTLDTGRLNACNQCHLDRSLGWTAEHLADRYGQRMPELTDDQRSIAATILHGLEGDAAQRAFVAWSLGWAPARDASGADWMAPLVAELMRDPYHPVRFMAFRTLRTSPEFTDVEWDFMAPTEVRETTIDDVLERWRQTDPRPNAVVSIAPDGSLMRDVFDRLLRNRDLRPVFLTE